MKPVYHFCAVIAVLLLFISGCSKPDTCTKVTQYKIYTPVYKALAEVRVPVKSEAAHAIENPGKIYLYGHYIFLNELNKGIHIIDNSKPATPQKVAFINIPGNVDMAVKGNTLYADSYMDLVTVDISNPTAIKEAKRLEDVFSNREHVLFAQAPAGKVMVDFNTRDTTVTMDCSRGLIVLDALAFASFNAPSAASLVAGKGGSMARFALIDNYLYTVDASALHAFDIRQSLTPVKKNKTELYSGIIETIFPYGNTLFIGSQNGMYIFDATTPGAPVKKGTFIHAKMCDPVVVENDIAYVTLRAGNECSLSPNSELNVLDVKDLMNPVLIKSYPMSSPYGVGVDRGKLFVCEGANGIRFMNAQASADIKQYTLLGGINAYDVIPHDNLLLVTAKDGLYQYDYTDMQRPRLISKIDMHIATKQ
jgi:hypothetical protein